MIASATLSTSETTQLVRRHAEAAAGRVAGDTGAVDTAPDHQEIADRVGHAPGPIPQPGPPRSARRKSA
jgi:hypothetical protein